MKIVHGNLLDLAEDGVFDVIVHGCNCQHTMGAGIAKQIKERFPKAYQADLDTPKGGGKLGTVSAASLPDFTIVNAYTQDFYGPTGQQADYDAIRSSMHYIKTWFYGKRIGYPRIGAGLGGGDWSVISKIIDEELEGEDHTLVEYVAK